MASEAESKQNDVVAFELPAPVGWVKKFTPKKSGTPQRNVIVFISPTGEEIKNKRQLDQYLKSHPGGPAASEFDWGTGDTPRRSSRLSEKSKAPDASQSPRKRRKKSSAKEAGEESTDDGEGEEAMEEKEKSKAPDASQSPRKRRKKSSAKEAGEESTDDGEGEEATEEKDAAGEEIKGSADMDTKEAVDGEAVTEEAIPEKPDTENAEMKTENEEPSAVGTKNDADTVVEGAEIEESKGGSNGEEIQDGKVDCGDKDDSKGKQEAEKPVENEDVLQEPTTGS